MESSRVLSAEVLPGASWRRQVRGKVTPALEIDVLVGRRIRARREALGMSQGALGRSLGVTFSQVQKYEKGSNRIGAGRLYQVATVLGVPVQYFFEGIEEPAPAPAAGHVAVAAEAERLKEAFVRIDDAHARQALLSLAASMVNPPR
jgi:transcriptional regulator with XRE-family HTH domain